MFRHKGRVLVVAAFLLVAACIALIAGCHGTTTAVTEGGGVKTISVNAEHPDTGELITIITLTLRCPPGSPTWTLRINEDLLNQTGYTFVNRNQAPEVQQFNAGNGIWRIHFFKRCQFDGPDGPFYIDVELTLDCETGSG